MCQDQEDMNHYQQLTRRVVIQYPNFTTHAPRSLILKVLRDSLMITVSSQLILATKVPGPGQYGLDKTGMQKVLYFQYMIRTEDTLSPSSMILMLGVFQRKQEEQVQVKNVLLFLILQIKLLLLEAIDCHLNLDIMKQAKVWDIQNQNEVI